MLTVSPVTRPSSGPDVAWTDLAGVDADAQLQGLRPHPEARLELLERADQRQPGPHGALGVVVAGARACRRRPSPRRR